MRLTQKQLDAIREVFLCHFLAMDNIWLFGSRVDDAKKGGDIDLYIETYYENDIVATEKKLFFSRDLKKRIGDQKIDIIVNTLKKDKSLRIYNEAKSTGVQLNMKTQTFLTDYIVVANIHAERLSGALAEVKSLMPLTAEKLAKMKLDQVAFLDMITMRFGKLQDIIGAKIFSLLLIKVGEGDGTFIDKLNKLEKLGYLDNANWWLDLREIRNQVMHDYPDDYDLIAIHLSTLMSKANELLQFWETLKIKIESLKS